MTIAKRCPFCAHKLDENGYCQNKNCADYTRTQILEKLEDGKKDENVESTASADK